MLALPPAVSEFHLLAVVGRWLAGDGADLESAIRARLGSVEVLTGSSWVLLLSALLEALARRAPGRNKVIIPSFSCNEFNLAALAAGLEVVVVDLDERMRTDPERLEAALSSRTLAVLSVNNLGCESDNGAVRIRCAAAGVACIEDATYTLLGHTDRDGRPFGSYGDFAVLNFSEGKILPIGGGALCRNTTGDPEVLAAVRQLVGARPPRGNARELADLLLYRLGSSRLGFGLHSLLKAAAGVDLKRRLSREPTRVDDLAGLVERTADGRLALPPGERERVRSVPLRPHNRAKQLCGLQVLADIERIRERRSNLLADARGLLPATAVTELPLPRRGVCIKAPFLCREEPSPERAARLARLGVLKGYRKTHPTYGDPSFPNSNAFYERVITIPLHRRVDRRVLERIVRELVRT